MITPDSNNKIIFVNINKSYEAYLNNDKKNPLYRSSIYDCTVKFWNVKDDKAYNATHIIGCYKGIVKEVVKITSAPVVDTKFFPGRKIFSGIEQPDSKYIGQNIRTLFKSLANFHTKYFNL